MSSDQRDNEVVAIVVVVALCGSGSDGYVRHLDTSFECTNTHQRLVTAVYYLNRGWKAGDGGCLRVYCTHNGDTTCSTSESYPVVDIEPFCDRLVIFRSDKVQHEVLHNVKMRMALTMWFNSSMKVLLAFTVHCEIIFLMKRGSEFLHG